MGDAGPDLRSYSGSRVLVAGAFGFIGSHLTRALVGLGAEVTAVDIDPSPGRLSLLNLEPGLRSRVRVRHCDVVDPIQVRALLENVEIDYLFNLTAFASVVERAALHPLPTITANTLGTVHLLEAVRTTGQQLRCFAHASTDKVYGSSDAPYDEVHTPLRGTGIYEASKLAADVFVRSWFTTYQIPTVVLRFCNIFGPYDLDTFDHRIVPKSFRSLFGGPPSPPELYCESSDHRRDYLFIDDCCRVILLLGARAGVDDACLGKPFNLPGCAHVTTETMCREIIEAAATVAEVQGCLPVASEIRHNGFRMRPDPCTLAPSISVQHADGRRIRAATGFEPEVELRQGLARTAEFYWDHLRARSMRDLARERHA